MNIEKLVEENPNDMELGKKIREMYWNNKEALKQYKDVKIYESPDGGHTIYERPFGGDSSQRKLVTKQLNLFE
jgi:hypothetical protein